MAKHVIKYDIGEVLLTYGEIQQRLNEMAHNIRETYMDEDAIHLVCVLEGARRINNALKERLERSAGKPVHVHEVKASSYVGNRSTGNVIVDRATPRGLKRAVIPEDVIEKGNTVRKVKGMLEEDGAKVDVFGLIVKPECMDPDAGFEPDYVGHRARADQFVIGFGIDWDGDGRGHCCVGVGKEVDQIGKFGPHKMQKVNLIPAYLDSLPEEEASYLTSKWAAAEMEYAI
ncbi:MAG: phosphoribosyltransferase [Candidatus Aenigmatarchaeota archaeon]